MVNASPNGALIFTEERPVLGQPLRIRMASPVKSHWFEAVPVRFANRHAVGMRFVKPCPADFFSAAVGAEGQRCGDFLRGCW